MTELQFEEYRYWAIRRNRTNCKIRGMLFTEFFNIDAGYCLDNAAVCYAEAMGLV